MCATVVIAAVSPLARDAAHSTNTLKYAAPLRVAVRKKNLNLELDKHDPALWTNDKVVSWMQSICSGQNKSEPDHAQLLQQVWTGEGVAPEAAIGHDVEVEAARARKAAAAAESLVQAAADAADDKVKSLASLSAASALSIKADAIVDGLTGVQLCQLPEPELHRRVKLQLPGAAGAALAKLIHESLWTMIHDAKTRSRRPDGTIITPEEEEAERKVKEEAMRAKGAVWKGKCLDPAVCKPLWRCCSGALCAARFGALRLLIGAGDAG